MSAGAASQSSTDCVAGAPACGLYRAQLGDGDSMESRWRARRIESGMMLPSCSGLVICLAVSRDRDRVDVDAEFVEELVDDCVAVGVLECRGAGIDA